jgi:hypothetical protein
MAINFLNTVDLNKNSLDRAVIQNLTADPTTGNVGQIYYNTVNSTLRVCVTADTAAPTNAVWSSISGDITEVKESLVNGLLGIDVLNPTGPIPVVGLDIAGLTALGAPALDDSLVIYDLSTTTNKKLTIADIVGTSTWLIEGDGANPQTVVNGDTVDIVGGTYITSVASSPSANNFAVTLTHDLTTRTDTTSAASPASGTTFTAIDSVTTNTTGHVTALNVKTVTLPPEIDTTYTLPVSAGTAVSGHSVADIDLTDSTPTIVSKVTYAGLNNEIKITETTGNNGIINIALADGAFVEWATTGTNLQLPENAVAKTQATGDNTTKVATTAFVQLATTGLLQFVGGFNANTGDRDSPLTGDLYTDVELFIGDYYVVTTAGDFFGNAATPLTPGDSVIVQSNAAAGAAVEADFIVIQSDTDLATATTPGLGFVTATATSGIDVSYAANNGSAALTLDACELPSSASTPISLVGCDAGGTKKFPIANIVGVRGIKIDLSVTTGITKATAGGVTTYSLTLADVWQIGGVSAGVDGTNVQVEVTGAGQTVYADVNRSATVITIGFTGTITDGDYFVLLNNVG